MTIRMVLITKNNVREAVKFNGGALAQVIVVSLNVPFTEKAIAAILALSSELPHNFSVALLITVQAKKARQMRSLLLPGNYTYRIDRTRSMSSE